ncbi:MAG: hypothetical protein JWN72_2536 [Thermoleophilia bacterium]|nr:hypothetical protein [Thermoleophilia bacterium]
MKAYALAPRWAKQMTVQPVAARCSLTSSSAVTPIQTTSSGSWISPAALPVGRYHLSCSTPQGFEPWTSRTKPVDGVLQVEEGRTASAVLVFRRPRVTVPIHQATVHYFRYISCSTVAGRKRCSDPQLDMSISKRFENVDRSELNLGVQAVPSPYGRVPLARAVVMNAGADLSLLPGLYGNTALAGGDQWYLYTAAHSNSSIGVDFGAPISWFYVHPDGRVETGPGDPSGTGLWMARWYCHSERDPQQPCPEGNVPQGRGPLAVGGSGGRGGG